MPARTGHRWRKLRSHILRRDHNTCHLCGGYITHGAGTADHLRPVSLGGAIYDPRNLKAAHMWCNRVRGNRDVTAARPDILTQLARLDVDPRTGEVGTDGDGWQW